MDQKQIDHFFEYIKNYAEKQNLCVSDVMTFFECTLTSTISFSDSPNEVIDKLCARMKNNVNKMRNKSDGMD